MDPTSVVIMRKQWFSLGTPYAELQSISINLQDLRAGQLTLKEMSEGMDREQKELDNILATYRVRI